MVSELHIKYTYASYQPIRMATLQEWPDGFLMIFHAANIGQCIS